MIGDFRQASHLLRPVNAIDGVVIPPNSNTFSDWRRTCHVPLVKTLLRPVNAIDGVVIPPNSNTFSDWRRTCHVPLVKTH